MTDASDIPVMTPNQVVAYNLRAARRLRGWTQEEAADRLERYIGVRWSKATWSAAERSVDGERIRAFTADDIFAFSQAFSLPVGWFFLMPARMSSVISSAPEPDAFDSDVAPMALDVLKMLFPADSAEVTTELGLRVGSISTSTSQEKFWSVIRDHLVGMIQAYATRPQDGIDAAARRSEMRAAAVAIEALVPASEPTDTKEK